MLTIKNDTIAFTGKPAREVGAVRFSPSFHLAVQDVRLIGHAPRMAVDDESSFIVLVDKAKAIYYFNTDLVEQADLQQLEQLFSFSLRTDTRKHSFENRAQGLTDVLYPASMRGKPLFKGWSWLSPRGFLKNLGYTMGTDNPMWERLTEEVKAGINW